MALNLQGSPPYWFAQLGSHAERDIVRRASGLIDGLVINANLVEGTPAACYALLADLGEEKAFPFIIDPMTYSFGLPPAFLLSEQRNRKTGALSLKLRRTFASLARSFGSPFEEAAGKHALLPENFADERLLGDVVERVLDYQSDRLEKERPDELWAQSLAPVKPVLLVPPYFHFTDVASNGWWGVNLGLARSAISQRPDATIYPMVCLDRPLLREESIRAITSSYGQLKCDGFIVWVSGLQEKTINRQELNLLVQLISGLSRDGRAVVSFHAGLLAALAGATAVSHAIGYGEFKDVIPVLGGGPPRALFYYPPLKDRLRYREARQLVLALSPERYHQEVCDCDICRSVITHDVAEDFAIFGELERRGAPPDDYEVQTRRSIEASRLHFAARRYLELEQIRRGTSSTILEEMRAAVRNYRLLVGIENRQHLEVWSAGLS